MWRAQRTIQPMATLSRRMGTRLMNGLACSKPEDESSYYRGVLSYFLVVCFQVTFFLKQTLLLDGEV